MFGYDLARLPNLQLAKLEAGVQNIEEARQRSGATIGYPGWGVIYHLLLAHLDRGRNEVIVETGTNWGCTTIVLAQALVDAGCSGRVITFELDPANAEIARSNIAAAGLERHVELHVGDSRILLEEVLSMERSRLRAAFLDASHLHDDVLSEFETILPMLAEDALVLFDNTYRIADEDEDQRVNGALKTIRKRHGGNLINLEFVSWYTPGLAIWQRAPAL
uniref:SAM-dependent methyltransferase n=1 Tax=uncultured bacterium lac146 TaxID=1447238 RepID=X2LCC6_9BACT|nr:SAM-dependent methyltransferase [uncultured bacterium lac146]